MSTNCLRTTFKGVVPNNDLNFFNSIAVRVKNGSADVIYTLYLGKSGKVPYQIFGDAIRCDSSGNPYSGDTSTLAGTNYFKGSGDYVIVFERENVTSINTYNGGSVSDSKPKINSWDLYGMSTFSQLQLSRCQIAGDLMQLNKVNKNLSLFLISSNSVYESSSSKLEDILVAYDRQDGDFEVLFQADCTNLLGGVITLNNVNVDARHIATYSASSIVVKLKSSSAVVATYNKSTGEWTY